MGNDGMAILNYTTKVPVSNTMAEIQKILVKAGADAVLSEYGPGGVVASISFRVQTNHGPVHYRLPADIDGVTRTLKADKKYRDDAHSERVAWRIVKDWIEAQMAIIQAQMAELPQVFLPYAKTNTGETVYERVKNEGLKMLGSSGE
jgi:hypothetical protein